MLRDLAHVVLTVFICFQISDGQNAFLSNGNPFSLGTPSFSGASAPRFVQDSISSATLNSGNNFPIPVQQSTSFSQAAFPESVPSSSVSVPSLYNGNSFQIRTEPSTSFSQATFPKTGSSISTGVPSYLSTSNGNNFQFRTEQSTSFSQAVYPASGPSSSNESSFQIRTEPGASFSQGQFQVSGPSSSINVASVPPSTNENSFQIRTEPGASFSQGQFQVSGPSSSVNVASVPPSSNENNFQILTEPSASFYQAAFPASELSSSINPANQNDAIANISPVENFVNEFNSAVNNSKVLPYIFDIKELSPEEFSKFLNDNIFSRVPYIFRSNPLNVTTMPNIEGMGNYTSPMLLEIYANAIAKYLFAEGTLDLSNISSAARKYAGILEKRARISWKKETPKSKFLALGDGFIHYMRSNDRFTPYVMNDLANYFANEVQRVGNKF